jgi:hypothetical protein
MLCPSRGSKMHSGWQRIGIITSLVALLPMAGQHAAAETAAVINLSCDGTMQPTGTLGEPTGTLEPVKKWGLIVNLTERTVLGFGVPAHIDVVDETHVEFRGRATDLVTRSVQGGIDRVTGGASAWVTIRSDEKVISEEKYELVCKATNRLF